MPSFKPARRTHHRGDRLEGRSSIEIRSDRRINSGHASRIRKDEPQFAVISQRFGGEVCPTVCLSARSPVNALVRHPAPFSSLSTPSTSTCVRGFRLPPSALRHVTAICAGGFSAGIGACCEFALNSGRAPSELRNRCPCRVAVKSNFGFPTSECALQLRSMHRPQQVLRAVHYA